MKGDGGRSRMAALKGDGVKGTGRRREGWE
jgi:hypothetical protein